MSAPTSGPGSDLGRGPLERTYWLDKKENVAKVFYALCALCAGLFLGDLFYEKHVHFALEGWFGFYALYGFVGAFLLVMVAKQMRRVLMRGEDYYDR